ncbi:MAG: sigma-70 family RNA polymerase sigma factor [Pseudomonadales bacterium]|nr:sigma-70 family RNA polymerase sigma factor [Pseudomonadales bacterium]
MIAWEQQAWYNQTTNGRTQTHTGGKLIERRRDGQKSRSGGYESLEDGILAAEVDTTDLTRRMKRLEDASFEQFFRLYYRRLWAYLSVMSQGDSNHIEEALQRTLEQVVKHIRVFNKENELWAWLSVIARNAYLDLYRRQRRLSRLREAMQTIVQAQVNDNPAERHIEIQRLDDALMLLDESEQSLVRKKYFEGYSYRQIAQCLGLTEKAVESKLARTRTKLRQLLVGDAENA